MDRVTYSADEKQINILIDGKWTWIHFDVNDFPISDRECRSDEDCEEEVIELCLSSIHDKSVHEELSKFLRDLFVNYEQYIKNAIYLRDNPCYNSDEPQSSIWISLDQGYPPENTPVIVWFPSDSTFSLAIWDGQDLKYFVDGFRRVIRRKISHWALVPPPINTL